MPGLSNPYGGLTFKYDDSNTLLIGGAANGSAGRIHQVGVIRDANMHITGFSGTASVYPIAQAAIGLFNDGGVAFGPQNVLFVTRSPVNQVEQSKVGSSAPDKVVDLSPLGVVASTGSIGFVPPGFPGAGSMKIVSFTGGGWYHADFVPDGSGTFDITAASLRANIVGGPEGIAFVPPGSPVFPSNSVLIALYGLGKVVTAPLDANGDPILANAQDVLQQLGHADGACMDPVTGDFLFGSFNAQGQLIRVSGFEAPTPTPTATVTPTPPATATATPRATATAKTTRDTTSVALASITLNPGNLTGGANHNSTGTVTLSAAAPAGGAVVMLASNKPAATVQTSVTVAAGATTATFTVATTTVTAGTIATITATYDGISKSSRARREHAAGFLDDEPFRTDRRRRQHRHSDTHQRGASRRRGGDAEEQQRDAATPASGSVTVAAGATIATFAVTTSEVTVPTQANITATCLGASTNSTLTLNPRLVGVSVFPAAVTGGNGSTGTVTLGSAAPAGGAVVTLTSSNTNAATVPGTVTVAAGATTKTFAVTTIAGDGPDGRDHHGHIQRRGQDRDADGESGGGSSARRKRQSNGSDG